MRTGVLVLALVTLALVACGDSPTAVDSTPVADLSAARGGAPSVTGRFIVTARDEAEPAALARDHGVRPDFVYRHALNGFAGSISEAAREGLLRDRRVLRVERDGIARAITDQAMDANGDPWGLDRIDDRSGLDQTYTYTATGAGVIAYIIDTGIWFTHGEFAGRASSDYFDVFTDGQNGKDCNGHGTHVAGTVGGTTYGVAKGVTLVAVRVLNCSGSGTWSGVIAGMDWVVGHHGTGRAIANMSLGGGANSSVDDAVRRMIGDGVATAVAAGNGNQGGIAQDACKYSPARVAEAMTIGATTKTDTKTSWSNYGKCVDWFAPGSGIRSAWKGSDEATNTISGTSMASPHTAGVAALYLELYPGHSPATVAQALYDLTTKGVVTKSRTTKNHLLFTSY